MENQQTKTMKESLQHKEEMGEADTALAETPLSILLNHPISQAHGLTGRECKELLKAVTDAIAKIFNK